MVLLGLAWGVSLMSPTIADAQMQVGRRLRTSTDNIMDQDGLTNPNWRFQWIRVQGTTETNIPGATSRYYTIDAADLGYQLKVQVDFTDDNGNEHTLFAGPTSAVTSAVWLTVSPNPVSEGSSVTVTAHLSAALGTAVTIPVTLTAGTAEPGDYGSLAGISIAADSTTGTGTVTTAGDADIDDETFTVALGAFSTALKKKATKSILPAPRELDLGGSDDRGGEAVGADQPASETGQRPRNGELGRGDGGGPLHGPIPGGGIHACLAHEMQLQWIPFWLHD